ncbi:Ig-like domain-containing protein [Pseudoxanthomonas suwonensis]|uniref:Tandem-95 repeat protein n=1 Tax=Pseudoxanthomonas suwonensis TaxID=314722 RepID=A0A0E3UMK9_9GAMM|nr:Ig-like domain-containing protein [Pseudoxanthomonas suwonensis]AKC86431.1 hypothetical protein WQ53_06255 [Pseudoxanthomonas suwonensis]
MIRKALSVAISISLILPLAANAQAPSPQEAYDGRVLPLAYGGSHGRIGIAIDQDGDVQGEARGVLGFDGKRASVVEGWLGAGGAGGLAFGFHWLQGERVPEASVVKLLLAADQNRSSDRKATLGVGVERRGGEFNLNYSRALTGRRLAGSSLDSDSVVVEGILDGRPYRRLVTTDVLTELFERPYEQGLGVRFGRYYEASLLRLRGGLDYERGGAMLAGDRAGQFTASAGIEKHFAGTRHSVALDVAHARKYGPFENDRDDTRAMVRWRFEFGRMFRVAAAPADDIWLDRALRNLPAHKRAVDTYRVERTTQTVTEGPIEYLNGSPVAMDDEVATPLNTPIVIDVLANDSDPNGDVLSVSVNYDTGYGTLVQQQPKGGVFTYTPDPGYEGVDFFIYTVTDGKGGSATASVKINVSAAP